MSFQSSIQCPDCGSPILFDSQLLLTGQKFSCSNPVCTVAISLNSETEQNRVANAFKQFEQMKQDAVEKAGQY